MNRRFTNFLRQAMDNYLPPALRESYYLMYPLYLYWFRGSPDIRSIMEFKARVLSMSDEQFAEVYKNIKTRANERPTDCSEESLQWVIARLLKLQSTASVLDVGCGRGYCLERFSHLGFQLTGCDIAPKLSSETARFVYGTVEQLPFPDKSFDVVTCFHTLEHVRRLTKALTELRRVARNHVFIIVPRQRYFRYTLDLHLHFFYSAAYFSLLVDERNFECEEISGDIVYHADLTQGSYER